MADIVSTKIMKLNPFKHKQLEVQSPLERKMENIDEIMGLSDYVLRMPESTPELISKTMKVLHNAFEFLAQDKGVPAYLCEKYDTQYSLLYSSLRDKLEELKNKN